MIVTQQLASVNFSEVAYPAPTSWDLSSYIPTGALDQTHIEARIKPVGDIFGDWGAVTAFDNTTLLATFTTLAHASEVEFRRNTPRYAVYHDPQAVSSRVSQTNLQANADQGLFVAVEWAAQYGIDAYAELVPTDTPNTLGLIQQTQNHWAATADWTHTSWDFQFAGGYIDRDHVKAQVLLSTGWQALTISDTDPSAPFRFIGNFQLFLDFSTLAEVPLGLIIYRHTPRDMLVDSPLDHARITANGMRPSATHALFVAVELGEVLSQYVPPCSCRDVPPDPGTTTYGEALLADDPYIWWKMDETSGTTGADSGRLGLPFTLDPTVMAFGGDPLWDTGNSLIGNNEGYNGSHTANTSDVNFPCGFTITALVNWTPGSEASCIVSHGQTNIDWANWSLQIDNAGALVFTLNSVNNISGRTLFTTTATLNQTTTYRVAARWDAVTGAVTLWINDDIVLSGTWAHALWAASSPCGVGAFPHATGGNPANGAFMGRIDEVAIYDVPLADSRLHLHWVALDQPAPTPNYELREDGGYELREDGSRELRE